MAQHDTAETLEDFSPQDIFDVQYERHIEGEFGWDEMLGKYNEAREGFVRSGLPALAVRNS